MADKTKTYRTKTGKVLTDSDIEALADEVETRRWPTRSKRRVWRAVRRWWSRNKRHIATW